MSGEIKHPSAEEVLVLFRQLSFQAQQKVRKALHAVPIRESYLGAIWVTVSEAARYSGKSRSQISRDCKNKRFPTNGKQWRDLRVRGLFHLAIKLQREIQSLYPSKRNRARNLAAKFCFETEIIIDLASEKSIDLPSSRDLRRAYVIADGVELGLRKLANPSI
jgi:hypothetical protein